MNGDWTPENEGWPVVSHWTLVEEQYSFEDADFKIYARDSKIMAANTGWAGSSDRACKLGFLVHRDKLAAASPVFADMLELGSNLEQPALDIPMVQLVEDADTVKVLLGFIYNETERLSLLSTLPWDPLFKVWEAANKFEMPLLAYWAADAMSGKIRHVDQAQIINALTSCQILGQGAVRLQLLGQLASMPWSSLSALGFDIFGRSDLVTLLVERDKLVVEAMIDLAETVTLQSKEAAASPALHQAVESMLGLATMTRAKRSSYTSDSSIANRKHDTRLCKFKRLYQVQWGSNESQDNEAPHTAEAVQDVAIPPLSGQIWFADDFDADDADLVIIADRELATGYWSGVNWQGFKAHRSRLQEVCPEFLAVCESAPLRNVQNFQGHLLEETAATVTAILTVAYLRGPGCALRSRPWSETSAVWQAALRFRIPLLVGHTEDVMILNILEASVKTAGPLLKQAVDSERIAFAECLYGVLASNPISAVPDKVLRELAPDSLTKLLELREDKCANALCSLAVAVKDNWHRQQAWFLSNKLCKACDLLGIPLRTCPSPLNTRRKSTQNKSETGW